MENDLTALFLNADELPENQVCYDHIEGGRMLLNISCTETTVSMDLKIDRNLSKGPIRFSVSGQVIDINIREDKTTKLTFYEDTNSLLLKNMIVKRYHFLWVNFSNYIVRKNELYRNCVVDDTVKSDFVEYENCEFRRLT